MKEGFERIERRVRMEKRRKGYPLDVLFFYRCIV